MFLFFQNEVYLSTLDIYLQKKTLDTRKGYISVIYQIEFKFWLRLFMFIKH